MVSCWLFVEDFNLSSCISLKIEDGNIVAPVKIRNLEEIKLLQQDATTTIVLSQHLVSLFLAELPNLSIKKLKSTVPYALEDNLTQNVELLHFAFDKKLYNDNFYKVLVIEKLILNDFIAQFKEEGIAFQAITTSWFALNQNEQILTPSGILLNTPNFKGMLSKEVAPLYLKNNAEPVLCFKESCNETLEGLNLNKHHLQESYYEFIAKRLLDTIFINLCQGDFQIQDTKHTLNWWYRLSQISGGLLILFFLGLNGFSIYNLKKQINNLDTEIAAIYHDFFPNASSVISPKFRIEQLIKQNSNKSSSIYHLLNALGVVYQEQKFNIEKIQYVNNTMLITLSVADFKALHAIETSLRKANVNVKQKQANSQNELVVSNMELSV